MPGQALTERRRKADVPRGPQVGVEAQSLPEPEQPRLGAHRARFPLGTAHRAQEDGVARATEVEGLGGKRIADRVDGRAADLPLLDLEGKTRPQNGQRRLGDLGSDAVSSEDCDRGDHVP